MCITPSITFIHNNVINHIVNNMYLYVINYKSNKTKMDITGELDSNILLIAG